MPKILPLPPYRKYAFYNLNITVYFGTFIYSIDTAWDWIPTLPVLV